MTPNELAGNVSSILVLCAYSMTDILALRVTAIAATLLSLCFQYYRPTPLWIPIRWNAVLLAINMTMVTTLYLERQRANHMDPKMEQLFVDGKFQKRGFSRVEFLRLFNLAETVTLPPGHVLIEQGQVKRSLHFLLDGKVRVSKRNDRTGKTTTLATLDRYHFIGEISLLSRMAQDLDSAASANVTVVGSSSSSSNRGGGTASAGATFLKWEFETLEPYLKGDRQVMNALSAYFNHDLTRKLLRDGQIQRADTTSTVKHQHHEELSKQQEQPQADSNSRIENESSKATRGKEESLVVVASNDLAPSTSTSITKSTGRSKREESPSTTSSSNTKQK